MVKMLKKFLIFGGCGLGLLLGLKLVENLPAMFTTFQASILLSTIVSIIVIILVRTILRK